MVEGNCPASAPGVLGRQLTHVAPPLFGVPTSPPGWLKLNFDGAYSRDSTASLSVVVRDSSGSCVLITGRGDVSSSVLMTELRVCLLGLFMLFTDCRGLIVEVDSMLGISLIQDVLSGIAQGDTYKATTAYIARFDYVQIAKCIRSANLFSDHVATMSLACTSFCFV